MCSRQRDFGVRFDFAHRPPGPELVEGQSNESPDQMIEAFVMGSLLTLRRHRGDWRRRVWLDDVHVV